MGFEYLLVRREGDVEHVVLNRPDVRNAFDDRLIAELGTWAQAVAGDPSVRVVVMSGSGKAFCAGADLNWMSAAIENSYEENVRDATAMASMFAAIDRLPIPVVVKVHSSALGGGCGLVAVADVAIAEEGTMFGFSEVKLGLVPAVIAPFVLSKIGHSAARELFTTGRRFDASYAQRIGLIHRVAADLDAAVAAYVSELLSAGPTAIAVSKALLKSLAGCTADQATAITVEAIARQRVSPEGQDGMSAFLQKRRPRWLEPRHVPA